MTLFEALDRDRPNLFLPVHPLLKGHIAHYTVSYPALRPDAGTLTLIPDASGCLVFKWDGARLSCSLWGSTTKTVTVFKGVNADCMTFFVEFLPCGGHSLLRLDFSEFTDLRFSLEEVNPKLFHAFSQVFQQAESLAGLVQEVNRLFLSLLPPVVPAASGLLHTVRTLPPQFTVKELSAHTAYSARHLNRLLSPTLGLSLKGYLRLVRINQGIQLLKSGAYSLTRLAQELGYYDQSHFNHDFKAVCGVTPSVYRQNLSDFYNEDFKF